MRISPGMKFIDTCGIMLFINKKDVLRLHYNLGNKSAESCVAKREKQFYVPMPALGEAVYKIHEKCRDDADDVLMELNRLIRKDFLVVRFINNSSKTFQIAKQLSSEMNDDRDTISPMDAFILATAITEQDCTAFYTTDMKLILDTRVKDIISESRDDLGFQHMNVYGIDNILRS